MRNFYAYITLFVLLFSGSLSGQNRIYAPDLRTPENGQANQYPNVLLDWDAVTGQTTDITYEVQIATKEDFSDATTFERTRLTALKMADLTFGNNYYWRVKAFDSGDPSEWSEEWKFQVAATVDMSSPSNESMVYADPLIKWDSINGLTKYELQIDTVFDWKMTSTGNTEQVNGTFVVSETNMWSVGESGTVLNHNGTEWLTVESGVSENLNSVYFIDEMNGYAVGEAGTVIHYDGTAWTTVDVGSDEDLSSISFVDATKGWAVGNGGTILKFDNGTWSAETSGLSSDLYGVFALSASDVWACGKGKIVAHYNGTEWSNSEQGTKDHYAVWFTDSNNGWIVGKSGEIIYYNGTEWVKQTSGTNKDLYSVSFDGMEGYAVGKSGTMLYYNISWTSSASGTDNNLNGIYLADGTGLSGGDDGDMIVETGMGFTSPYVHIVSIPYDSASWELSHLLYGTKIYYRMRGMHSADTSIWSGGKSMETYAAPALRTPNNNSKDTDLALTFKWNEYSGSTDYFFEIDSDEAFSNPFMVASDSTSADFTMKMFGQDYYWRVRAAHALDVSDWSEVRTLKTVSEVTQISPANNETDVSFCPRYTWEEIEGSPQYEILIGTDPDFTGSEGQFVDASFFQCNQPLDKKSFYYWKVRGVTSIDSSAWSETWKFETEGYAGIEDEFTNASIEIYPNPATDNISISLFSFANDSYRLSVIDITGKLVSEREVACNAGDNTLELDLSNLEKGMYFINIRKKDKTVTKKLFIK